MSSGKLTLSLSQTEAVLGYLSKVFFSVCVKFCKVQCKYNVSMYIKFTVNLHILTHTT